MTFLSRWGPALALMAVIFVASAIPGEALPNAGDWDVLFKKGGHVLGYLLLGGAYLRGLAWARRPTVRDVGTAILLAALYATSDELHQRFTPGRTPAASDVGIDVVGATAGASLLLLGARRPRGG